MSSIPPVVQRFDRAFVEHDPVGFEDLIHDDCVMEAIEPAPDGARYAGKESCLGFWLQLIEDQSLQFTTERIDAGPQTATIRFRLQYGAGPTDYVRGVNLIRLRDGLIVEALGYGKTPAANDSPLADLV